MGIRTTLVLIGAISLFGCKSPNTPTAGDKQTVPSRVYYYFPKTNVYFDSTEKIIYYFDSTKKSWQTAHSPNAMPTDLGKGARISHPSQPVWSDNKEHQLEYSAILYADSSDFKTPKVKKQAPVVKQQHEQPPPAPKKKIRVKDFFDRLFHKKRRSERH
jgi:hypothetical protein